MLGVAWSDPGIGVVEPICGVSIEVGRGALAAIVLVLTVVDTLVSGGGTCIVDGVGAVELGTDIDIPAVRYVLGIVVGVLTVLAAVLMPVPAQLTLGDVNAINGVVTGGGMLEASPLVSFSTSTPLNLIFNDRFSALSSSSCSSWHARTLSTSLNCILASVGFDMFQFPST